MTSSPWSRFVAAVEQIADYERRLFGRSTKRVPPVDRGLRHADEQRSIQTSTTTSTADATSMPRPKRKPPRSQDVPGLDAQGNHRAQGLRSPSSGTTARRTPV
jgi:hypothetical protein